VCTAVRRRYGCERDNLGPEWASLAEFTLRPGAGAQRIDLLMVRAWSGRPKGHERVAIEVKVSRSDFLAEVAAPHKRAPFEAISHRFYFATPAGLVRPDEMPAGCGLIEVTDRHSVVSVAAPRRADPDPVPEEAFVEAFRRASRLEARIRHADGNAEQVVSLTAEVASLTQSLTNRDTALSVERRRSRELLALLADEFDVLCARCQGPLVAKRTAGRSYYSLSWEHRDDVDHFPEPDAVTATRRS